jgi:peroxiredoxin
LIATYDGTDYLTTLRPQMNYYLTYDQTMAEPAIYASVQEDLYLVLFSWDPSGEISLSAMINPLSGFLWLGGMVVLLGGGLAWWPRRKRTAEEGGQKRQIGAQIGAVLGLVLAVAVLFALWGDALNPNKGLGRPLPGELAPSFSAPDIEGDEFRLLDYRGEVVVLNFWATWCAECEDEIPEFESIWREVGADGVQFVGVAMNDSVAAVSAVARDQNVSFPLIVEEEGQITSSYGVTGVPETFIIDQDGKVAFIHVGVVDSDTLMDELVELTKVD